MQERDATAADDAVLGRMIAASNEEGLRTLVRCYGWRIRAFLAKRYGAFLQPLELDEAFNAAIFNAWRSAARFDAAKGSLGAWCIGIAQHAAQSIIRREFSYRARNEPYSDLDDPDDEPTRAERDAAPDPSREALLDDLRQAVEQLPPLQKAIIRADLAAGAGGVADAGRLAAQHETDKNTVYVSRHKARASLRAAMVKIGHLPDTMRQDE